MKYQMKYKHYLFAIAFWLLITSVLFAQNKNIVFQTDFGLKDGAVSAMKGVALSVSPVTSSFTVGL